MGSNVYRFLAVLIAVAIPVGCGTTHHFFPPAALEKKEWRISTSIHYDIGKPISVAFTPELSVFWGVGKDMNFGFGYQFPYQCSHVSLAKYWKSGTDDYWAAHLILNQLFAGNNNPYVEIGGTYSAIREDDWQVYKFGIAYGHSNRVFGGLFSLADAKDEFGPISQNRLLPVLGFQIGGRDVGFSYSYYFGGEKAAFQKLSDRMKSRNDTVLLLRAGEIDSIITRPPDRWFYGDDSWSVYLRSGDTIIISQDDGWYGCVVMIPPVTYEKRRYIFQKKQFSHYSFRKPGAEDRAHFYGDMKDILESFSESGQILIQRYPRWYVNKITRISNWTNDHSVSIGIFSHPRDRKE